MQRVVVYSVEVMADTASSAETKALTFSQPTNLHQSAEANALRQLGEPWVYGWSGDDPENSYLGRPDQYRDDARDLLVFRRAIGHGFTADECRLLLERIEKHVGKVRDHWNGVGSGSFSVKLAMEFGTLTDAQVAAIMAPMGDRT